MFLSGRVTTDDGTPLPNNVQVERICNTKVRQQVYASGHGDFSMQLGSMADSYLDASGERPSQEGVLNKNMGMGIPRRELANCDLRASVAGFHSSVISLVELGPFDSKNIDVGKIVVQRRIKIEGNAVSAMPYKAPNDARKAYEKGLDADSHGKTADARKYFERAVAIYPKFTNAWFQLGTVLEKENQKDGARTAFTQAMTLDAKFLPPYLSLAAMACESENWMETLKLTGHILDLEPLDHVSGYVLDLDPMSYADAYFYNALANFKLNKIDEAEKSGLKAERVDLRTHFPQLHLLLAEIFARKRNYGTAIAELRTYLELVPFAKDSESVRARLAKFEKLNTAVASSEKPN